MYKCADAFSSNSYETCWIVVIFVSAMQLTANQPETSRALWQAMQNHYCCEDHQLIVTTCGTTYLTRDLRQLFQSHAHLTLQTRMMTTGDTFMGSMPSGGTHLRGPRKFLCHDCVAFHALAPLVHHEASIEIHIAHVSGSFPQHVGALLLILPHVIQVFSHPLILPLHYASISVLPVQHALASHSWVISVCA